MNEYTRVDENSPRAGNQRIVDPHERLMARLAKLLQFSRDSTSEAQAALAATKLQELLTEHNLDIADLEKRGSRNAPEVRQHGHDLGKAAFTWKLNLAEMIAQYYFCHPIVDRTRKTVSFVGRPDNVESLQMLYAWVIDQIKKIATQERRNHFDTTGEHIDPLRWQIQFGIGAVERLEERLIEMKARQEEDREGTDAESKVTALVVAFKGEISDYLEEKFGYRIDGRETKERRERRERREKEELRLATLKETDIEAYYDECPWERPETEEQKKAREERDAKYWKEYEKKQERNRKKREAYIPTGGRREKRTDWNKLDQESTARESGRKNADRVNLTPFLNPGKTPKGSLGD